MSVTAAAGPPGVTGTPQQLTQKPGNSTLQTGGATSSTQAPASSREFNTRDFTQGSYSHSQYSGHLNKESMGPHSTSRPNDQMDILEAHNTIYHKPTLDGPNTAGLLARFEARPRKAPSSKMILSHLPAATAEHTRYNYLKPNGIADGSQETFNYHPSCDIRDTRFHRGFQRRHQSDIRQDAPRLQKEFGKQIGRDTADRARVDGWHNYKEDYTFNLLNGEGRGRDAEFKAIGKRVINPVHDHAGVFDEHDRDQRNRHRQSMNRFYEYPPMQPSANRENQIVAQGFISSNPETVIIGYSPDAAPRLKMRSQGAAENFAHLQDASGVRQFAPVRERNKSQIIFG
mmetsp:Transcript_8066/g.19494  ORF Transcript_8066/g.19494 Transcript_8066/m.19494 type:complete len:343 (+) Transcript_8066:74-1102(+)|eukprot:g7168.t1